MMPRRYLVEYDDVINKQREIIYKIRIKFALGRRKEFCRFQENILGKINQELESLVERHTDYAERKSGKIDDDALLNEV